MNRSYWQKTKIKQYPPIENDIECDVLIIGGGLSGICTAYHLNETSLKTVVVDKDSLGAHTSSHSSAKVTVLHGLVYNQIAKNYGNYFAYLYYKSNLEAMNRIKQTIDINHIDCGCEYVENYIYTNDIKLKSEFDKQRALLESFKVSLLKHDDYLDSIGMMNQMIFDPVRYLKGLIKACNHITFYEHTLVSDIKKVGDQYHVYANNHIIKCKYVVHATRYPMMYRGFFFTKMYQSHKWLSFNLKKGEESLLCLDENYSYRKADRGAIEISKDANEWYAMDTTTYRHIPYIGRYKENEFVIYGFAKWGMTLSEVAGNLISDLILEKKNVFEQLYSCKEEQYTFYKDNMTQIIDSLNKGYIKGRMNLQRLEDIKCNEGGIVKIKMKLYAVYKDEKGTCYYFSPYCRHMLCLVHFDKKSHTWMCPCHQSVYNCFGEVLEGPSIKCLKEQKV